MCVHIIIKIFPPYSSPSTFLLLHAPTIIASPSPLVDKGGSYSGRENENTSRFLTYSFHIHALGSGSAIVIGLSKVFQSCFPSFISLFVFSQLCSWLLHAYNIKGLEWNRTRNTELRSLINILIYYFNSDHIFISFLQRILFFVF